MRVSKGPQLGHKHGTKGKPFLTAAMIARLACPGEAIIELTQTRKESIGVVGSELYTQKSITLLYRKSN